MPDNYETGGVPPMPEHLRDVQNKCQQCGSVFVGAQRALCSKCEASTICVCKDANGNALYQCHECPK